MARCSAFPYRVRAVALFTVILLLTSLSCSSVRTIPVEEVTPGDEELVGKSVIFHHTNGDISVARVKSVDPPVVHGEDVTSKEPVDIDLRNVSAIYVKGTDAGKTILAITLVGVAIAAILAAWWFTSNPDIFGE